MIILLMEDIVKNIAIENYWKNNVKQPLLRITGLFTLRRQ
jgi:hypothetical protein